MSYPLVSIESNHLIVKDVEFYQNDFKFAHGGNIHIKNLKKIEISNLISQNNKALHGGSIYMENCQQKNDILIKNSVFQYNYAQGSGGAIFSNNSNFNLTNCQISNNNAMVGGGIRFIGTVPDFYK